MELKQQDQKKVYSDGQQVEEQMLEIAKSYPEDASQDYIAQDSHYTVNNTFSSVRRNILNWYPFRKDADILEIGAGMGALTGLFCDVAKSVTAVEMSKARAEVIRARYPQRRNLDVISEDITEWNTNKRFDYVIFIGVLEYAGIFSDDTNPYERFLDSARKLLKEDGVLLFAIENRFGLKYWLGGAEDHLQKPFVGVAGYKDPKTAKTFSKAELEEMLDHVGLKEHRVYAVYPDYKFPEIICTDEFTPSYMNLQKVHFTYSKNSVLTANEKELYKQLTDNKVWDFFANSFLVEASYSHISEPHIIHVSAKGECKKQYRVSTVIFHDGTVKKIPMHSAASAHIDNIFKNNEILRSRGVAVVSLKREGQELISPFVKAQSAQTRFVQLMRENDRQGAFHMIDLLKDALLKSSDLTDSGNMIFDIIDSENACDYGPILENGYVDMTFYNAFLQDDELVFYDQEWCFEKVPLRFILYYSVKSIYTRMQNPTEISFEEILRYIEVGEEREQYDRLEDYVWSHVLYRQSDFYGEDGYCNRYSDELTYDVQKEIEDLEHKAELEQKNAQIEQKEREVEQKEREVEQKVREIEKAHSEILSKEREIAEKNRILEEKNVQINNQRGHIEQLLEVDRHYQNIIRSKGWRVVSFPGRVFEKLYPQGTKRRARMSRRAKYAHALNWTNVKYVGHAFREGGFGQVRKEFHDFEMRNCNEMPVEVPEVSQIDEITDINSCRILTFQQQDNPDVSIVIPVYNQFTYTYHCLESILENTKDVSYEVIIADDVSGDLTVNLADVVKNITIIRNKENQRFLRNCNHAAQYARGKYILFLNNDTQVQENWLAPLVELIERDEKIGMVGSKLIYPDGTLQEAGGIIWGDGHAWNYGNGQNANMPEFNYVKEVDYISGASLMIRADLWREIGGFDELFVPAYCEDSDLAFEVRKRGYKLMYQPLSVVVHFEGKSNGTDTGSGVKKYQIENSEKLKIKWKDALMAHSQSESDLFHARERSQSKLTILVIDHYVPQYDKDAGSKTTWQYLKMFVGQGYNVKFIGDNFFRDEPYTMLLQQMGIEVLYGPWYAQNYKQWILDNKDSIDFVYLNRPHITEKYIDFLRENTNIKCIYYGHDLHFLRLRREYELSGDEKYLKESEDWKKKELDIMHKADINYYPSYVEVDEIHKIDASIPAKAITAYVYDRFREDIPTNFDQRRGILFVGGFGHPPNEDAVVWFASEIYPEIRKKYDIPFYIVGSNATDKVKKLQGNGIVLKGFVTEEELEELYYECRLVVVPLRFGAGVKGKVIEAMYYGTPMVTTSVGAEGISGAKEIIAVADDAHMFAQKVVSLYTSSRELEETSKAYQNYICENNSVDAVWSIVRDDFQKR